MFTGRTTLTLEYGFEKHHDEVSMEAEKETMSYSLEAGIQFKHGSVGASMNYEHKTATAKATKTTYDLEANVKMTVHCPDPLDPQDTAVGYYMFMVDAPNRSSTAKPALGVCRYGALWNTAPECPFSACIDSQCTLCRDW